MSTKKRFTKRTIFLLALAALVLIGLFWDGSPLGSLVLRQAVKAKFSSVRSVTPAELVAWRADPNRPPALLVDARPEAEFTMSHINGAVWIDPAAPDLSVVANVPKGNPVVVYDAAGTTAAAMAQALQGVGYARVSYLEGGGPATPVTSGRTPNPDAPRVRLSLSNLSRANTASLES